jgi:hypothetical protein
MYSNKNKMAAIAAAGVGLMVVCSSSVAAAMMMGGTKKKEDDSDSDSDSDSDDEEEPVIGTSLAPAPSGSTDGISIGNQGWRDTNPGSAIAVVSAACAQPKTFDGSVTYTGPSGDNYANYCHEMVISQSAACKTELCANDNVYGACKDEC